MKGFQKQLQQALKHIHDPEWLGSHSVLAAPYFLSSVLEVEITTAEKRGAVLQQEIFRASETLWGANPPSNRTEIEDILPDILQTPGNGRYDYLVLELRYLRRFFKPRRLSDIWDTFLGESRAEFYRDLDRATAELGKTLLHQLNPTFRLESPVSQALLVGREVTLTDCLNALLERKTVALSGGGGVGKTALGSTIASQWTTPVFWMTFRPTLNDQLGSLLFSLAYFFHKEGSSQLWQYLVANIGKIEDVNLALGFIRTDLESLHSKKLLLCFDEVDRLRVPETDRHTEAYQQILEFLESLRGLCSMVLIGQRALIETDMHHEIQGLNDYAVGAFLTESGITLKNKDIERLTERTHGNPRLLQLFVASYRLQKVGETAVLDDFIRVPTLQPLFDRLWRRLKIEEQQLLQALSVFRSPAPIDAWSVSATTLSWLQQLHLVQFDNVGSIELMPSWQELVYSDLPPELREQLHIEAATIRLVRGEYTAVSYHYFQAGKYREAIRAWFPYRKQEIARGQTEAALAIFQQISLNRLHKKESKALAIIRAELKQLVGDLQGGLKDLKTQDWTLDSELTIRAQSLQGHFLYNLGYPEKAIETYGEGVSVIYRLQTELAQFYNLRSRVFFRQRDFAEGKRELMMAQYETILLQAMLAGSQGEFIEAQQQYQQVLRLAEEMDYAEGIAKVHRNLAHLLARQAKLQESIDHSQQAIKYYEQIGDQLRMAMVQMNLPAAYIQAKKFNEAVESAHQVLPFFEKIRNPHFIAITAANLAEAYFELGDIKHAEEYAFYVMRQEDPHAHPYGLYTLALVRRQQGQMDHAHTVLLQAQKLAETNRDTYLLAYVQRLLGEVLIAENQIADGRQLLEETIELFINLDMKHEADQTEELLPSIDQ